MDIVLFALNGSFAHSSLSVRCLAKALLDAGFCPTVIEGNLRDRSRTLRPRLVEKRARLYGLSCYIWI